MFSGIYSAASAMETLVRQQETISHNLANANTNGFRRMLLVVGQQPQSAGYGRNQIVQGTEVVDFSPGSIRSTDRPLDLAIDGDGFFVVQPPSQDNAAPLTLYTRDGNFNINENRQLTTAEGAIVLGDGQPIEIPQGSDLQQLVVNRDGTMWLGSNQMGRIDVVKFDDNSSLRPVGASMFAAGPQLQSTPAEAGVIQGSLESANTSAIGEMIQMIAGMRSFEAAQRSIRAIDEALQQYTTFDR